MHLGMPGMGGNGNDELHDEPDDEFYDGRNGRNGYGDGNEPDDDGRYARYESDDGRNAWHGDESHDDGGNARNGNEPDDEPDDDGNARNAPPHAPPRYEPSDELYDAQNVRGRRWRSGTGGRVPENGAKSW